MVAESNRQFNTTHRVEPLRTTAAIPPSPARIERVLEVTLRKQGSLLWKQGFEAVHPLTL
jgi:hypothetical protein